jgi:hypothetical protein
MPRTSPSYGHILPVTNSLSTIFLQFYINYMRAKQKPKTGRYAVVGIPQVSATVPRPRSALRRGVVADLWGWVLSLDPVAAWEAATVGYGASFRRLA